MAHVAHRGGGEHDVLHRASARPGEGTFVPGLPAVEGVVHAPVRRAHPTLSLALDPYRVQVNAKSSRQPVENYMLWAS